MQTAGAFEGRVGLIKISPPPPPPRALSFSVAAIEGRVNRRRYEFREVTAQLREFGVFDGVWAVFFHFFVRQFHCALDTRCFERCRKFLYARVVRGQRRGSALDHCILWRARCRERLIGQTRGN